MISIGVYRHFKGEYYYVTHLVHSAVDEKSIEVVYFNVCHPEFGSYARPVEDFEAEKCTLAEGIEVLIKDRPDNVTGQIKRFERVKDLNYQIGSVSTEQLILELRKRKDSPIHELDIEGLMSDVFVNDWCVCECYEETLETPKGCYTLFSAEDREKCEKWYDTHKHKKNTHVMKRTFIRCD